MSRYGGGCPRCGAGEVIRERVFTDEGILDVERCLLCGWSGSEETESGSPSMEEVRGKERVWNDYDVDRIKEDLGAGMSYGVIARRHGVSKATVYRVNKGKAGKGK